MTEQEVKDKAREVHDVSFEYHLTHAFFACDKILLEENKKKGKEDRRRLKNELAEARRKKDFAKCAELNDKIASYKKLNIRKYRLFIDYIDMDIYAGRVINAEDRLAITLPKKLADATRDKDGSLISKGVAKYRKIMGHELGHIILHTEPLLNIKSKDGSMKLKGQFDIEADWFSQELLNLYDKQNHSMIIKQEQ
jgi:Zn-dependent peptidase ImmA (M78 family)